MRALIALLVLAVAAGLLVTRAEPLGPSVELTAPVDVVGHATPVPIVARDRGSGLASVELRLVPQGGGEAVVLGRQDFPRTGWLGSGVHEVTLTPTVDAGAAKLAEGPATLEIWATDHSWLSAFRRGPRLTRPVTVDLTPPTVTVLSTQHVARLGGSECAVYRVGPDTTSSGVRVGEQTFPGTPGLFADASVVASLFAVPHDADGATPAVVARDAAGNERSATFDVAVKPRRFAEKTLTLSDDFLSRKVPELLAANGLDPGGDLVAGYLRINRELRTATEERVRAICKDSAPQPLWQGPFLRLPNSAPLSGFADRRSYVYGGSVIDHQTHLGFDLASLKQSPVPAGNTGRIVFAGPLGIYGQTVIIDHGLGLFSLYGHLSEITVQTGASVTRGEIIGKTGDTGLAGGDHLHFSIMVRGIHVDPVEWWDGHWIHDHVDARLASLPKAGTTATPAGTGTPPPAPAAGGNPS